MTIEMRNRIIVRIQKEFNVGYARASHLFMFAYNEPMFIVEK